MSQLIKEAIKVLETCSETKPSIRPLVRALKKEAKESLKGTRHYVIHVYGCTDPQEPIGPFKNARTRDLKARKLRNSSDEEDAFFWLDVDESGTPTIGSYSNGFMEGHS